MNAEQMETPQAAEKEKQMRNQKNMILLLKASARIIALSGRSAAW